MIKQRVRDVEPRRCRVSIWPSPAVHSGVVTTSGIDPASERSHDPCSPPPHPPSSSPPTPRPSSGAAPGHRPGPHDLFWTLVERLRRGRRPATTDPSGRGDHLPGPPGDRAGLLRAFLAAAGDGDVGPTLTVPGDCPDDPPQVLPRLDHPGRVPISRSSARSTIERTCYGHDRVEAAPLDARLHLPRRQYSYLLQQWLGAFVVDDAHAEAVRKLGTILGLEIPVKASEDLNREQASDVEVFQDHLPVPDAAAGRAALGGDGRLQGGAVGAQGAARRRRRPTPRLPAWRTSVGARARRRTRRRWRRWGRCIRSSRSSARPTR